MREQSQSRSFAGCFEHDSSRSEQTRLHYLGLYYSKALGRTE